MSLPKRPPLNQPIPNADIPNVPEQYTVKAPYWDAVVSGNLTVSEDGTLSIEGSTTPPLGEAEVQGPYWNMPLGNGLGLWRGEFRTVEPEFPPYGCRTDVITTGVTDFTDAWRDCTFSAFPADIDTSSGTNFTYTWSGCENLTSFPSLDVGSGTNFQVAWEGCTSLTSFPSIDTSSGTDFGGSWADCAGLTSFPYLDVSQGVEFGDAWYNCSGLTSFPLLDVSNGENFNGTWGDCTGLTSFPNLNFSSGLDFNNTWSGCTGLVSFPGINVGSGTVFNNCWYSCTNLTFFPGGVFDNCSATSFFNTWYNCALSQQSVDNILLSLDTAGQSNGIVGISGGTSAAPSLAGWDAVESLEGKGWTVTVNGTRPRVCDQPPFGCRTDVDPYCVTDFKGAWAGCSGLTSFPLLDTSSGVYFSGAWGGCSGLTSFPILDTSSGEYFGIYNTYGGCWNNCSGLITFPQLDFSSGIDFNSAWYGCTSLTTFPAGMFDSCSATSFGSAWDGCALSQQSVDNILISIDAAGQLNGTLGISGGTSSAPSTAGWAAYDNLVDKGWTVSVNGSHPLAPWPPVGCNPWVDSSGVTDFSSVWQGCTSLKSFPLIDTSSGTNFQTTWQNCSGLTSFPLIDVSHGINFAGAWGNCVSLTSFPLLNISQGTNFQAAWCNCPSITSFPSLNVSQGDNFFLTWGSCTGLTSFPAGVFDSCMATNFLNAWFNCALDQTSVDNILVSIDTAGQSNGTLGISGGTSSPPSLVGWYAVASLQTKGWTVSVNGTPPAAWPPSSCNTNVQTYGVNDFTLAWNGCYGLSEFPMMNTGSVVNFTRTWGTCLGLTSFPMLDVSSGTDFTYAWSNCQSLASFPLLDVSSGVIFEATWYACMALTSFPMLDVSSGTNFRSTWHSCNNLASFPALDFSSGTDFYLCWAFCTNLTTFPPNLFNNCTATNFALAWKGCALNQQSVDNILISLDTAGQSGGSVNIDEGTSSTPGPAGLAAKASLQAKGWTVTTN